MSCCPASEMNSCVELLHIVLSVTSAIQSPMLFTVGGGRGATLLYAAVTE
jgi:hypothetical protein